MIPIGGTALAMELAYYAGRKRRKGTGMGLSAALGIAKNYGVGIDFQAAPGSGAVFTVSLPLKTTIPPELASASTASASIN
jgi:K+-sensing histidine kinase KdpD